jgi:hypothetical protein
MLLPGRLPIVMVDSLEVSVASFGINGSLAPMSLLLLLTTARSLSCSMSL